MPPRRALARLLLTVLGLGVASLPAAAPYLFGEGLPRTNDALPHLYRVVALDRLVRAGQLWPRWSPDFVHGYGYPLFNFSPAFAHWLVELLVLAGLSITLAYRLAVFAHFWLAASGAYFLGRRWFSTAAGWAAAIAYSYSPYFLYDAHVRGGLQETQALAVLPWLVLALSQAVRGERRWIALTAVTFGAALLSHYPVTFQAMLILGIWLLFLSWRKGWRTLVGPGAGLVLGGLLTAFSWLPSLAELESTQAALRISEGYNFTANFLTWRQMLAWPPIPADPALINPPVVRALPAVALAVTVVCLLWVGHRLRGKRRWQVVIWSALLLLALWFVTPSARLAWEKLPLLAETFYPWRFLGIASLATAILLALAVDLVLQGSRHRGLLLAGVTAVLVIAAIPWLYPPREPVSEDPGLDELYQFEAPPLFIGGTTLGEFLPRWVEELPDTSALRAEQLASGDAERLLAVDGITFDRLAGPVWDAAYEIQADGPTQLVYRQFYFPGWRAALDGEPLPLQPSEPEGLITFTVPAGAHRLTLTFGSTPARTVGWLLSAGGAAGIVAILAAGRFPWRRNQEGLQRAEPGLPLWQLFLLAGLVVGLWLFFTTVETPLRRATLSETGVAGRPAIEPLDFAGEVRLLSFESPQAPIAADDPIPVTLALRALRPIGVPYLFGVDVVDDKGLVWNATRERPADWRFVAGEDVWPLDGYRIEPFVLRLLDGTPPGNFHFRIGLVRADTGETVALQQIGRLVVGTPARGDRPLEAGMEAQKGGGAQGLVLLGSRLDRSEAAPGDPLRLALLWQVTDARLAGNVVSVHVRLERADGQIFATDEQPLAGDYPPASWQEGDRLRTEIVLRLPARVPSGNFTWYATLVADGAEEGSWPVGTLQVEAPEHHYSAPAMGISLNARLGETATLVGATVGAETLEGRDILPVTLVWRAEAETSTSYRVFLQLLGPEGAVVSQSDGEPARWTRPTSGWQPGEIVVDERQLTLPTELAAGNYRLVAGLYAPESGARLRLANGADAVTITHFEVASDQP